MMKCKPTLKFYSSDGLIFNFGLNLLISVRSLIRELFREKYLRRRIKCVDLFPSIESLIILRLWICKYELCFQPEEIS